MNKNGPGQGLSTINVCKCPSAVVTMDWASMVLCEWKEAWALERTGHRPVVRIDPDFSSRGPRRPAGHYGL